MTGAGPLGVPAVDRAPGSAGRFVVVQIAVTGSIATDHLMTFRGAFSDSLVVEQLDKISVSFLADDLRDPPRRGRRQHLLRHGRARRAADPRRRGRRGLRRLPQLARAPRRRSPSPCTSRESRHTARFVCTTDDDMAQIATFYAGAMSEAREIELGPIARPSRDLDLVLIGADDPEAMLRHTAGVPHAAASPSSPTPRSSSPSPTAPIIRSSSTAPTTCSPTSTRRTSPRPKTGLEPGRDRRAGHHPGDHPRQGRRRHPHQGRGARSTCRSPARSRRADPTGVGDAFRAGFLTGLAGGLGHERVRRARLDARDLRHRDRRHAGVHVLGKAASSTRLADAYGDEAAPEIAPHVQLPPRLTTPTAPCRWPTRRSSRRRSPWDCRPRRGPTPGDDLVGGGRRPRARHAAGGLPRGLFPMGLGARRRGPIGWWSPDPRGVCPPGGLRVSRSLRKVVPPLRRAGRHRLRRGRARAAPTPPRRAGGSPPRSPTPTPPAPARLGAQRRDLAGRRARRRALRRLDRRPVRRRVDVPHGHATPRRSRSSALVGPVFADGDPRPHHRRPVGAPTTCARLGVAGAAPRGVPRAALRRGAAARLRPR